MLRDGECFAALAGSDGQLQTRRQPLRRPSKGSLLATYRSRQQQKLAELTLQEAELAFQRKEFEVAFELFTHVLLDSAGGGALGETVRAGEAQRGARKSRLAIVAAGGRGGALAGVRDDLETLSSDDLTLLCAARQGAKPLTLTPASGSTDDELLAKADELAGCCVSFASPPVDYPDSPTEGSPEADATPRPAAAAAFADVELEAEEPRAEVSAARRRALFQLAVAGSSRDTVTAQEEEEDAKRVTLLSTPRAQLALLESLSNCVATITTSFLSTRCWRTECGAEVILRHYPGRCDISVDGGRSWRSQRRWDFFLAPSRPIVLPLALQPAVEPPTLAAAKSRDSGRAAIHICRGDYSLARWRNAEATMALQQRGTLQTLESVPSPLVVGHAGHTLASRCLQHDAVSGPRVVSCDVRSFVILNDSAHGGHFATYEIASCWQQPGSGRQGREVVQRRFRQFAALHAHIQSAYSGTSYALPKLPPKTFCIRRFDGS